MIKITLDYIKKFPWESQLKEQNRLAFLIMNMKKKYLLIVRFHRYELCRHGDNLAAEQTAQNRTLLLETWGRHRGQERGYQLRHHRCWGRHGHGHGLLCGHEALRRSSDCYFRFFFCSDPWLLLRQPWLLLRLLPKRSPSNQTLITPWSLVPFVLSTP